MTSFDTTRAHTHAINALKHNIEDDLADLEAVHLPVLQEMEWLKDVITTCVAQHLEPDKSRVSHNITLLPSLKEGTYSILVKKYNFEAPERVVLALALACNYRPDLLDSFLIANPATGKPFREFGGVISRKTGNFIPTLRTAIFLLSSGNQSKWIKMQNRLVESHPLFREQIVNLKAVDDLGSYLPNCQLHLDSAYFNYFFNGTPPRLDAGDQFPATLLKTSKTFDDLILAPDVFSKLSPALNYVKVQKELYQIDSVSNKVNHGFIMMLYGPPGTGKTFTVSVLGNELGVDVYKIDASMIVSKYIGETEKNLERVFNRLDGKNCILFFDEADAMFGKRTEVVDAKDRYANQEVSYLLQRIEKFRGLVILATNHHENLDDAFKRRIITKIHIQVPGEPERLRLWQTALPDGYSYESNELLIRIAKGYQLTGANISVIVKMCVEKAFADNTTVIPEAVLIEFLTLIGREVLGVNFRPIAAGLGGQGNG